MNPPVKPPGNPALSIATYVGHLRADADRMAAAYRTGPTDAPVAACPGWDVTALVEHMAYIHRWADYAVRNAVAAGPDDIAHPGAGTDLADWLQSGATTLADDLAAVDPDAPTWHPFPVERVAWVWARRQAHETSMHRWDAETATTGSSSLDPRLAADGITEYIELAVPRIAQREHVELPGATVRIDCSDVDDADHVLGPRRSAGRRDIAGHRRAGAARADGARATFELRDRGRRRGGRRLAVDPRLVMRAGDAAW